MKNKLQEIIKQFNIMGPVTEYHEMSGGHINETYFVSANNKEYVLQKINSDVFDNVDHLMHNIGMVTDHLMLKNRGCENFRIPYYYESAGRKYFILNNEYWRVSDYIGNSYTPEASDKDSSIMKKTGIAFGRFDRQLMDLDYSKLYYTIPHFHDTHYILMRIFEAAEKSPSDRLKDARSELKIIEENTYLSDEIGKMILRGELTVRAVHNDTKKDNILFDKDTLEPAAVIDLDTCMPGYICYDYGDAVRSGCGRGEEDREEGMALDMELVRAFSEGYLSEAGKYLTEPEVRSLSLCVPAVTLELAARFLEDYLRGDQYFRTDYEGQNLVRARAQLKLFLDMKKRIDDVTSVIEDCIRKY